MFKGRRGWPPFFLACVVSSCVVAFVFAYAPGSFCGILGGVEGFGHLRRESQREARTACLALVFGRYGGRAVLRGFCGGAIFCYRGCAPGWLRGCGVLVFLPVGLWEWCFRMRFHVNNQGRVLPCRAKHACRFGAAFENGGGSASCS